MTGSASSRPLRKTARFCRAASAQVAEEHEPDDAEDQYRQPGGDSQESEHGRGPARPGRGPRSAVFSTILNAVVWLPWCPRFLSVANVLGGAGASKATQSSSDHVPGVRGCLRARAN